MLRIVLFTIVVIFIKQHIYIGVEYNTWKDFKHNWMWHFHVWGKLIQRQWKDYLCESHMGNWQRFHHSWQFSVWRSRNQNHKMLMALTHIQYDFQSCQFAYNVQILDQILKECTADQCLCLWRFLFSDPMLWKCGCWVHHTVFQFPNRYECMTVCVNLSWFPTHSSSRCQMKKQK